MSAQAVILCGGLGTRLGAVTASTPKPMLPVNGKPFLDTLIQETARYGISEILLLAGRFGEQVKDCYDGRRISGAQLRVLVEPSPRGTGGALRFALPELSETFLLLNGDTWIDADLAHFLFASEQLRRSQPETVIQILLHHVDDMTRFGGVAFEGHRVIAFREKDPQAGAQPGYVNAGVYCISREIVKAIPADGVVSLETDILTPLVSAGRVAAHLAPKGSYFIDIGVPESYARAQHELEEARRRPALFLDRDGTLNHDSGYTHLVSDLRWIEGAREAIRLANESGYYVFVVTNQAGVARGLYSEDAVLDFHRAMQSSLFEIGAHVDAIEWCPHHPQAALSEYRHNSARRKPAPGMLLDLMGIFPVKREASLMVGDAPSDVAAAEAAGIRGVRYPGGSLLELVSREIKRQD